MCPSSLCCDNIFCPGIKLIFTEIKALSNTNDDEGANVAEAVTRCMDYNEGGWCKVSAQHLPAVVAPLIQLVQFYQLIITSHHFSK